MPEETESELSNITARSFSVAMWVRMPESIKGKSTILSNPVSDTDFRSVSIHVVDHSGHVVAKVTREDGTRITLESKSRVLDLKWHEIALSAKRGGMARLYIDGVLEDETLQKTTRGSEYAFLVGGFR